MVCCINVAILKNLVSEKKSFGCFVSNKTLDKASSCYDEAA